ncbi:Cobalamin biosynthesis protein CobE [hydrothermal vent metagenome]|uniref:Cobalamin biosynthesis protein CobE n=1 Tax=hydrothermal vent metagenome TaxID=652676 RepID=A0A3B1B602_9ZZZZ
MDKPEKIILGIGCDRNTVLTTLEIAVDRALKEIQQTYVAVVALATIDKKKDEVAMLELSRKRNWPLRFYSAEQLARVAVPNPSAVVLKYMGTPAVSEAAAMLAANTGVDDLLLEKFKYRGEDNKNATVSIVRLR